MRREIRRLEGCRGDGNQTSFASLSAACHLNREQSDVSAASWVDRRGGAEHNSGASIAANTSGVSRRFMATAASRISAIQTSCCGPESKLRR